jgi:hypothetical protein
VPVAGDPYTKGPIAFAHGSDWKRYPHRNHERKRSDFLASLGSTGRSFARFPDGGTRFSSAYHEWSFEMVHDAALAHSRHIHPAALPPRLNPALSQLHAFRAFEQIPWEWFAGDDVAKK